MNNDNFMNAYCTILKKILLVLALYANVSIATEVPDVKNRQAHHAEVCNDLFKDLINKHVIKHSIDSDKQGSDYNIFVRAIYGSKNITISVEPDKYIPIKDIEFKAEINNYNIYFDHSAGMMFTRPLLEPIEIIQQTTSPSENNSNLSDFWLYRVNNDKNNITSFSLLDKRTNDESYEKQVSMAYEGDRFFGDKMDYPSARSIVQLPILEINNPKVLNIINNDIIRHAKDNRMTSDSYDLFVRVSEVMPLDICTDSIRRVEFDLEQTAHKIYGAVHGVAVIDGYNVYFDEASAKHFTKSTNKTAKVSLRPDRQSPKNTSLWIYEIGLPLHSESQTKIKLLKSDLHRTESKEHYLYENRDILPLINARTY